MLPSGLAFISLHDSWFQAGAGMLQANSLIHFDRCNLDREQLVFPESWSWYSSLKSIIKSKLGLCVKMTSTYQCSVVLCLFLIYEENLMFYAFGKPWLDLQSVWKNPFVIALTLWCWRYVFSLHYLVYSYSCCLFPTLHPYPVLLHRKHSKELMIVVVHIFVITTSRAAHRTIATESFQTLSRSWS